MFEQKIQENEIKDCQILADFIILLSYLEKSPAKLTTTGNLTLKVIDEIAGFIPIPPSYVEHNYSIKNQQEWGYLDLLVTLAEVARFTTKRKGKKHVSKRGREYLTAFKAEQFEDLFLAY